jgi:hypothetical protein
MEYQKMPLPDLPLQRATFWATDSEKTERIPGICKGGELKLVLDHPC